MDERPRLLLVDDDADMRQALAEALDGRFEVALAANGEEGLRRLRQGARPCAVLLDLLMPEMSGYDLLEEMAHDEAIAGTQVIIVSVRSVEQESPPIVGELRLKRQAGFSLTEILEMLRATLSAITRPTAMALASAATLPRVQSA